MSTLTSATYAYAFDDLVVVRAKATNSHGSAVDYSDDNTLGAKIRTVPIIITTLAVSSYSDSQITLTWTGLTAPDNGNSAVLNYMIESDYGTTTTYTPVITTSSTSYTFTPTVGGTTYRFIIAAYNIYGPSTFSNYVQ
jgi:FtsP/CotA-like multicopper oxidase with cupredoxin domain